MYPFVNIYDKANFKELEGSGAIFLEKANTLPVSTLTGQNQSQLKRKRGVEFWELFSATDAIVVHSTLLSLDSQ